MVGHMSATPQDLLRQLAEAPLHPYPENLLREMIERRDEMIPALLEVLTDTVRQPQHYLKGDHWKSPTFACFLLAQFRVPAACKPLCAVLALPADEVEALFGDTLAEDMGRILAGVYDGDPAPLLSLVENREVNEMVRGVAVPEALLCLLAEGAVTREWLEARVSELLADKLEREASLVWDSWTALCADLGLAATAPLIEQAITDDLLDPCFYGYEALLRMTREGGDPDWRRRTDRILDTIKHTRHWAVWQKPARTKSAPPPAKLAQSAASSKVGRNEPCPCGSGQKFKKCCGRLS